MMRRGIQAVSASIIENLGKGFDYMTPEYLIHAMSLEIEKHDPQTIDFLEARRITLARCLHEARVGYADYLADDLIHLYLGILDERFDFYEGAHTTLEALFGKIPLGYITNGTTTPDKVKMDKYFHISVMPETLNLRKPRREVFLYAAERAGCQLHEMMHIGDNLYSDIRGALDAGCQAVWFNPRRRANDPDITPTAVIHRLSDVLELLPESILNGG